LVRRRKSRRALSRRQRAVLIGISLIGTALLIWLDRDFVAPRWSALFSERQQDFAADMAKYHGRTFPVVQVIDGDTLCLDAADSTQPVTKVRLIGIDAPEIGGDESMYFAREATTFARHVVLDREITVYLDQQAGSRDRYGRLLAYLQLPDGQFLNEELLSQGFAYADTRFRHGYYQKYQQLEASARALKEGLWARVQPGQMPPWRQQKLAEPD